MIEGWALWLLLVGLAVGAAGATVLLLRLPREDDDIGEAERNAEAASIAATIERHGGVAPVSLVDEVLELHTGYLATPRPPGPSGASAPPVPPMSQDPPLAPPWPTPPPGHASPPPAGPPLASLPPAGPPPAGPPPAGAPAAPPPQPPEPPTTNR